MRVATRTVWHQKESQRLSKATREGNKIHGLLGILNLALLICLSFIRWFIPTDIDQVPSECQALCQAGKATERKETWFQVTRSLRSLTILWMNKTSTLSSGPAPGNPAALCPATLVLIQNVCQASFLTQQHPCHLAQDSSSFELILASNSIRASDLCTSWQPFGLRYPCACPNLLPPVVPC